MGVHGIRARLARVVLESDTSAGRLYNLVVFGAILLSVVALLFEPAPGIAGLVQPVWVDWIDRVALLVFAADYLLHWSVSPRPLAYARSFTGLIDLAAVLFFAVPQLDSGLLLWIFKFGRILRVFKLLRFLDEARALGAALKASARRITVFVLFVLILQVVLGYVMVVVESFHPESQFRSVAQGVYWAIVTMTTVGYGDIVPQTALGRILAAVVMLLGFGIIAIPTGIVTVEGLRRAAVRGGTADLAVPRLWPAHPPQPGRVLRPLRYSPARSASRAVSFQFLKCRLSGLLFRITAGSAPAFRHLLALQLHPAVKTARITMALAGFLAAIRRQAELSSLAPFLQCRFGVAFVGVGQYSCTGALPVGGEPGVHGCQTVPALVESADQGFAGFGPQRCLTSGITLGFGSDHQHGVNPDLLAELRQPTVTHQLSPQGRSFSNGELGIVLFNEFTGCQSQHCIAEKFQAFVMEAQARRCVGEGFIEEGQGARLVGAFGWIQAQCLAEAAQLIAA